MEEEQPSKDKDKFTNLVWLFEMMESTKINFGDNLEAIFHGKLSDALEDEEEDHGEDHEGAHEDDEEGKFQFVLLEEFRQSIKTSGSFSPPKRTSINLSVTNST